MIAALVAGSVACGQDETSPSPIARLTIGTVSPASGSAIATTGIFLPREAGRISIPVTFQSDRDAAWAQLYVYLLNASGYCAQNLPDAPTWGPMREGQQGSVIITGFQVYQRPCAVTGIRAMLHTRNTGLLTPPNASETIAEATLPISLTIQ
jgi:hypothetical protein